MAGRLGLTSLTTGTGIRRADITNDLYERIVELCGWPR